MNPNRLHLELHVPDFEKVKDFYSRLGFRIVWENKPDGYKGYLVMDRQGTTLCFWPGNDEVYTHPHFKQFPADTPRGYGVELVIGVEDIESFYKETSEFAEIVEPLVTKPWGLKDFRIVDPFGYYIRFSEPHDVHSPDLAVK